MLPRIYISIIIAKKNTSTRALKSVAGKIKAKTEDGVTITCHPESLKRCRAYIDII